MAPANLPPGSPRDLYDLSSLFTCDQKAVSRERTKVFQTTLSGYAQPDTLTIFAIIAHHAETAPCGHDRRPKAEYARSG